MAATELLAQITLGQYLLPAIPGPDGTSTLTVSDRVQMVWGIQGEPTGGWVEAPEAPGGDNWTEADVPGTLRVN